MNHFLTWTRLAWNAGDMALASAQVIAQRAGRLALAGPVPNARDRREFSLMGREKGEAALESAQAMAACMMAINQQFAALAFKQMLSASAALVSIAASRTAAESAGRQLKFARDALAGSVVAASRLSGSTARLARTALKPVHTRVSGNAARLGGGSEKR